MGILLRVWSFLQYLASVVCPLFGRARWRGLAGALRWILHGVFVILILVLLTWLNDYLGLERALRSPWPSLHRYWLPLLFLFLYVLGWLGYWLWRLLGPEHGRHSFPDMDAAWAEGMAALYQASIDISAVPVYLVLGRPASGAECLFNAARLALAVQQTPRNPDAPVHVYATRDAVYVTCVGSSLVGHQSQLLADVVESQGEHRHELPTPAPAHANDVADAGAARAAEHKDAATTSTTAAAPPAAQVEPAAPSARAADTTARPHEGAAPLLKNKAAMQTLQYRLEYLCQLIVNERRPYCTINGIFALVPWAAAIEDGLASHLATLCQADLLTVRDTTQVECPVSVLLCDLEKVTGFQEFIQPLSETQRLTALGRRFALIPDLEHGELPAMFEAGIDFLLSNELANNIYNRFRLPDGAAPAAALAMLSGNLRLFQFLSQLRQQRKRLARIVYRGTLVKPESPPLVLGCFLVGTGVDATREQAFAAGVFQEMQQNQNFVSWTPPALAEEWRLRRLVRVGYVLLATAVLAVIGAAYFLFVKA